jgi:glc operon protein GlcG
VATGAILALAVGLYGIGGAGAQEPGPGAGRPIAEVRDHAGLFGADAIASAKGELARVARETGASIILETIESLDGKPADRVAVEHARRTRIRGVFILIAREERKLEVLGSGRYKEILTEARRQAIRDAFFEGFRRKDFNEGLKHGVAELARVLAAARPAAALAPRAPVPEAPSGIATGTVALSFGAKTAGDSPLVARNQVRLTLAGARAIIAGAEAKAQASGWKMNVAVVDDGGHLIAFERMEGARPASGYTAITKATTAATFRQPSGPQPPGTTNPDPLLNISLQNAAMASGGKITTLYGGVPVGVDGQVIGGVGVGGGTGEQDAQVARAGVQAFADQLAKPAADAKENERRDNPKPVEKPGEKPGGEAGTREDPDF